MGADQVIFADKVMCSATTIDARRERVPGKEKGDGRSRERRDRDDRAGRPATKGHKVEFSTQPGLQFIFWKNELNGDSEQQGEWMELAYAITIHKSQGSQFKTTFVVVPDPCALLTPGAAVHRAHAAGRSRDPAQAGRPDAAAEVRRSRALRNGSAAHVPVP